MRLYLRTKMFLKKRWSLMIKAWTSNSKTETKDTDDLHHFSVDELQARYSKALKKEEYELQLKLRDEIANEI